MNIPWYFAVIIGVAALVIGVLVGYLYRKNVAEAKVAKAEDAVKKLYEDAQKRAIRLMKKCRKGQMNHGNPERF